MTIDPMTVDDFMTVMAQNEAYYPDFAALPESAKRLLAQLNISTGTAHTFREDGHIVGVGGVRYVGLGEAWLITPPEVRDHPMMLYRQSARHFHWIKDEKNLWRIFAETRLSENYLAHLGFQKQEMFVWQRTL